jgi:hypothetical protein
LKLSPTPFCQGLPGSISAELIDRFFEREPSTDERRSDAVPSFGRLQFAEGRTHTRNVPRPVDERLICEVETPLKRVAEDSARQIPSEFENKSVLLRRTILTFIDIEPRVGSLECASRQRGIEQRRAAGIHLCRLIPFRPAHGPLR